MMDNGHKRRMAVKNITPVKGGPERLRRIAQREVDGMKLFQGCPYGMQLYGTTLDHMTEEEGDEPQFGYQLFMEVADKGTLKDELVSRAWSRNTTVCLSYSVVNGNLHDTPIHEWVGTPSTP